MHKTIASPLINIKYYMTCDFQRISQQPATSAAKSKVESSGHGMHVVNIR